MSDDRIWALTSRGLTSFDGIRWKQLSAPKAPWYFICPADGEGAWVSGRHVGDGVVRLDGAGVVEKTVALPTDIDALRSVEGFCIHHTATGTEEIIVAVDGVGFLRFDGSRWHELESPFSSGREVRAVVTRPGGDVWGCTDEGIVIWSNDRGPIHLIPTDLGAPTDGVYGVAFATGPNRTPWIIGEGWLGRLSNAGLLDYVIERGDLTPPDVIEVGPAGEVYFGSEGYLHRLDSTTETVDALTIDEAMVANGANAMMRDRDLNVWIGCNRGLTRIPPRKFHLFDKRHGLLEDEVSAIEFCGERSYFGHNDGLSMMRDGRFRTWELKDGRPRANCRVLDLEPDREGGVYFAANTWGLGRLRADGVIERHHEANADNPILSVRRSPDGILWVGMAEGLATLEDDGLSPVIEIAGDRSFIRRIDIAPNGDLILSTAVSGLVTGRPGRWVRSNADGPDNVYTTTRFDGRLLVGTHDGLFDFGDGRMHRPRVPELRIDVPVFALHVDPAGVLWCGTDRGVKTWDGEELGEFTARSGFAGQEVNRDALVTDASGTTWIGTETGVAVFLGTSDVPSRAPTLRIRSCSAGGRALLGGSQFDVSSSENTLRFELQAISFVGDASVLVRWRLKGHEEAWHHASAAHAEEIVYSNLNPGAYVLEVEALNARDETTGVVRSATVNIANPIWQRRWFVAVSIIALGLLGWGLAGFLVVRRERARLERLARDRADAMIGLERRLHHSEKLSALGQLAGGVAHDFNNLLTAIIGSCDMIRLSGDANRRVLHDIEPIERAAESGAALVEQLLAVGRRQKLTPEPIDLGRALTEFGRLARRALGDGVALDIRAVEGTVVALVDRGQLDQIVMNLLINAGDAMPDGGRIEVSASLEWLEADAVGSLPKGRYASLAVKDHGAGIPDEVLEHIFEPFFTTKEPGAGTGLGLASVYGAVRQARGDLSVETGPTGTTFRVYLPATVSSRTSDRPDAAIADDETPSRRVLVVDDDLRVLQLTAQMLRELGHEVRTAHNAQAAMELADSDSEQPFDVLLTDVVMPDGTGPELARGIRNRHPHTTVCFMTGFADLRGAGKDLPGNATLLHKPFRIEELAKMIGATPLSRDRLESDRTADQLS